MDEMINDTANALESLLAAPVTLRQLAINLYGDASKIGLLTDVRARHYGHVSHANLHDLRRRLGLPYDIRHVVDVPSDAAATVHIVPGGDGALIVQRVEVGQQVLVVPAGARVVRPKPAPPAWVIQAADHLARLREGR